jgi:hypothetical protein
VQIGRTDRNLRSGYVLPAVDPPVVQLDQAPASFVPPCVPQERHSALLAAARLLPDALENRCVGNPCTEGSNPSPLRLRAGTPIWVQSREDDLDRGSASWLCGELELTAQ